MPSRSARCDYSLRRNIRDAFGLERVFQIGTEAELRDIENTL